MSNMNELRERTEELTRQIGLARTEFGIDDINKKAEAIEREIRELRHNSDRLNRENKELKGILSSLITSVENGPLAKWNDSVRAVGKKMDAILNSGRTGGALVEVETTARLAVVPDLVGTPRENEAKISAESEPRQPQRQSILQRRPQGLEDRRHDSDEQDPRSPAE